MTKSIYRKVGIASALMMASVLLSRVIGLFREVVIAYTGGAGASVDAYQVAFVIPEMLNHAVASGFLSVTFIPIFSRYLSQNREEEGWRIFSFILNGFGGLLIILIAGAVVFAPRLVALIAPGLRDPQTVAGAVYMTRIVLPAQFFFFAGGMFMAVQFAKERFFLPALAPLIYNLGIITGGVLLGPKIGMAGFSWGVLAGAFVGNFAIQYLGAMKIGLRYRVIFDFTHPDFRKYVFLTLPLMVGLTMTFSTEFFLKFFGSYLPPGNIASLNYGLRVMLILVGFFGQAVGVATFPFLARLSVEDRMDEMNRLLSTTLRYLSLVIPISALMIVLRNEVVMILFQRGRFDAAATSLTAHVLLFLMIGAFAFSAQTVVVRGYYAVQNTLFPALFGSAAVLLSIPLYIAGMTVMGVGGVALTISLSAILQVALLYVLWNRRSGNPESRRVYIAYGRMMVLGIGLGLSMEWLRRTLFGPAAGASIWVNLTTCLIMGGLFILAVSAAGYLFRIPEVTEFASRIISRRRKP